MSEPEFFGIEERTEIYLYTNLGIIAPDDCNKFGIYTTTTVINLNGHHMKPNKCQAGISSRNDATLMHGCLLKKRKTTTFIIIFRVVVTNQIIPRNR